MVLIWYITCHHGTKIFEISSLEAGMGVWQVNGFSSNTITKYLFSLNSWKFTHVNFLPFKAQESLLKLQIDLDFSCKCVLVTSQGQEN